MKNKKSTQRKWKGYLNYSLSKKDKQEIMANVMSLDSLLEWCEAMCLAGYAISMSQTKDGTGLKLTMTGRETGNDMDGWSVTAWGMGLWQCLSEMHYIFNSGVYGSNLEGLIPLEGGDDWFNP